MPHSPVPPPDHQPTFPVKGTTKCATLVAQPGGSCIGKMGHTNRWMPLLSHLLKGHWLPPPLLQPQQGGSPTQPTWPTPLGDHNLSCPARPGFQCHHQPLLPYTVAAPPPDGCALQAESTVQQHPSEGCMLLPARHGKHEEAPP
ncbi:hypothetical protein E2320_003499, partial [Naja naja]